MSLSPVSLLGMPGGVENIILSFVSTGDGGLCGILNLRLVCKTTKSWVDNLPEGQGRFVFSRAHVCMDSDVQTLRSYLTSSPPFFVTALTLQLQSTSNKLSLEAEETWNRFNSLWNPKLESLNLQKNSNNYYGISIHPFLLNLIESPNLLVLRLNRSSIVTINQMSCLLKLRELHVEGAYWNSNWDINRTKFYSQLEINSNLRFLSLNLWDKKEFIGMRELIEKKKDETRFQLTIDLVVSGLIDVALRNETIEIPEDRTVFQNFAVSIAASKSKIRLQLGNLHNFEALTHRLLPRAVARELLSKVESALYWEPTEDSLSNLGCLPCLKKLDKVSINDSSTVLFDMFRFSPSLEEVKFAGGLPASISLPQSLTSLTLLKYVCDVSSLTNCLNLLRGSCPELSTLRICWYLRKDEVPAELATNKSPEFSKLRSLSFFVQQLKQTHVEDCQGAIINAFDWQNLQLYNLELSFQGYEFMYDQLPVVNKEILTKLCYGLSARTLTTIAIGNKAVTPEATPLLETLKILASKNWERRMETEGQGRWMQIQSPM